MLTKQNDVVAGSADAIDTLLRQKQSSRKKSSAVSKTLPKRLSKEIRWLANLKRTSEYRPYPTQHELRRAKTVEKKVRSHFAEKTPNSVRFRRWLADLVLNYFYLAFLLAGFWYVAKYL